MAHLSLHQDLSYCHVDGCLIFLDIRNDRYFRLAEDLEAAFVRHMGGGHVPESGLRRLVQQKILIDGPSGPGDWVPLASEGPTGSALEAASSAQRPCTSAMYTSAALDTFSIVCSTQLQLKTRPLKSILIQLVSFRSRRAEPPTGLSRYEPKALDFAAAFRRVRPFVPIETVCLVDSISIVRFLAKRRIHAHLVFGVTGQPFAAHCWAQHGDLVLNDTVGHVSAHTPIRVI